MYMKFWEESSISHKKLDLDNSKEPQENPWQTLLLLELEEVIFRLNSFTKPYDATQNILLNLKEEKSDF